MQKVSDFKDLSAAEAALIDAVRAGRPCVVQGDGKTLPDANNPAHRIRAELLAVLITGGSPECELSPFGVVLIGAQVTGALRLNHLHAVGDTWLLYCRFETAPNVRQAHFNNLALDGSHLPRLNAQGVDVGADLFLRRITAKGSVNLIGAKIGGHMDCTGATFDGNTGDALNAQGVHVGANLFLRGITATGRVDVNAAKIGGQMACEGATFDVGTGDALNGQGVDVEADIFMRGITAKGRMNLIGAKIGGQLGCTGATFDGGTGDALDAQGVDVGEALVWRHVTVKTGQVSLSAAHVQDLRDDVGSWPDNLDLDGFTYDRFMNTTTLAKDRLKWLKKGSFSNGTFSPQPYTQAAKVLRAMGHDGEARKILVEREQILAREVRRRWHVKDNGRAYLVMENPYRTAGLGVLWLWDLAQRKVVGYGFAPFLALRALAVLLAVAFTLAHFTWKHGDFAPNSDVILTSAGWQATLVYDCENFAPNAITVCDHNPANTWSGQLTRGMDWDTFNAPAYALDLVVPILTLGQTEAWAPSKDRGAWGRALWWGRWVLIIGGWLVSALGVAAITGVMQRERK